MDNGYATQDLPKCDSAGGYHLGQRRPLAGKQTPIENDINILFIIRGPGIAKK
ncbi:hypothetical protein IWW37_001387 [Coemansia sp. RSA 2050]|nr:hypothetical protein IWW37_001387 [Coemansia sp. RSA 2050]KAJ2734936.1 hypothetical protein IW152_001917 [Coemansia sp. BCRC 34962]